MSIKSMMNDNYGDKFLSSLAQVIQQLEEIITAKDEEKAEVREELQNKNQEPSPSQTNEPNPSQNEPKPNPPAERNPNQNQPNPPNRPVQNNPPSQKNLPVNLGADYNSLKTSQQEDRKAVDEK